MQSAWQTYLSERLAALARENSRRSIRDLKSLECLSDKRLVNLSGNDYLGLAADIGLRTAFLNRYSPDELRFSASSSRLLPAYTEAHTTLEQTLCSLYCRESALCANSGWHLNTGLLAALGSSDTLILADRLVHASLIDGIRLSGATFTRFAHNDLSHLRRLLEAKASQFRRVLIVTESLFSMDGDEADLLGLVALKHAFPNTSLYVDEAHAFGVRGALGLGIAEEKNLIPHIDFLVGTFGKAAASVGAFVICDGLAREYFINTMRPLIFSTALPPLNMLWTNFIVERLPLFKEKRKVLAQKSARLRDTIANLGLPMPSKSQIIPYMVGDNETTMRIAQQLLAQGFIVGAIRPPTVPPNTARLRFSISTDISNEDLAHLCNLLQTSRP